jgi:putative ABC transport system substrate-binding protein
MDLIYRCAAVLLLLLAVSAACARPATPQETARVYWVGYLGGASPGPLHTVFLDEMSRRGYVADRNLTIEYRWADGQPERLPELAGEFATRKFDAIFASSEQPAQALLEAGVEAPIIMVA